MSSARPSYGHTVHLRGVSYEDARLRITEALKKEGFGILTEIDVQATLRKKLDKDFRKYVILGACNPGLAYRGLQDELALGLLLPCNVCVWEDENGSTVSALRPDKMVEFADNPKLAPMAKEADEKLRRALGALQQAGP
ncbi:MAG: DUF302 domain-containing protein [Myxococcales bacterium]